MHPGSDYLTAQVLTATPQRLHLMLIDGAVRFAQQAKQAWNDPSRRQAREEALTRCVRITGEMLACIRGSRLPAGEQFVTVYAWLFRTVTEAKLLGDERKLDDALELLAVERETWRLVCERFGSEVADDGRRLPETSPPAAAVGQELPAGGLSLEA